MTRTTPRQRAWQKAANESTGIAHALFSLLALPSESERGHYCADHSIGFRTVEGRRGFRCGICREVLKWVDPE